jgi:hypothetical protein
MLTTKIAFGLLVLVMGLIYFLVKLDVLDADVLRLIIPLAVVSLGFAILLAWKSRGSSGGK